VPPPRTPRRRRGPPARGPRPSRRASVCGKNRALLEAVAFIALLLGNEYGKLAGVVACRQLPTRDRFLQKGRLLERVGWRVTFTLEMHDTSTLEISPRQKLFRPERWRAYPISTATGQVRRFPDSASWTRTSRRRSFVREKGYRSVDRAGGYFHMEDAGPYPMRHALARKVLPEIIEHVSQEVPRRRTATAAPQAYTTRGAARRRPRPRASRRRTRSPQSRRYP
jgi:hypothetical protein